MTHRAVIAAVNDYSQQQSMPAGWKRCRICTGLWTMLRQ